MTVGETIEIHRKAARMTQEALAKSTKVDPEKIKLHELGVKAPNLWNLRAYEQVLRLPRGELISMAIRHGWHIPLNMLQANEWPKVKMVIMELETKAVEGLG